MQGLSPRVRGSLSTCPTLMPRRVYPRVCGGARLAGDRLAEMGSIPACAGEPVKRSDDPPSLGSIPACAGEPIGYRVTVPRTGSIPACAGEPTIVAYLARITQRVYPRVCGGAGLRDRIEHLVGLSPRVRGSQRALSCMPVEGLSPRVRGSQPDGPRWVYPRECGGARSSCHAYGSIPASAGEAVLSSRAMSLGSIPASAGEPCARSCYDLRVYPRVCGGTPRSSVQIKP